MPSITGASRLAAILTLNIQPFLRNSEIALKKLQVFGTKMSSIGSGLTRSIGLAFGLIGVAAIATAEKFNEIETQLRAISQREDMSGVIASARELGRTTKFTSTEVLGLALSLKKLGFDATEVSAAMDTSTKLTQLFGGDLEKVGATIAEVGRQFNRTGEKEFKQIGDIFAVAFGESALDINNLGGALKNVGSVAAQSGLSLERTVALLGGLANQGQKAERAGTRLKTTLVRLGREFNFTEDQTKLITSGVLDTAQIFDLLKNRAGLAGSVISQSGEEIAILEERLLDATGALEAMSQGLEGELFISVARIKAGFEDMGITLGDALAPYVEQVADFVQDLAKSFDELTPASKDAYAQFTILAVVIPVVTALLGSAALAATAFWTSLGPIGVAVVGLSALFLDMQLKMAGFRKETEEISKAFDQFNVVATEVDEATGKAVFSADRLTKAHTGAVQQTLKNTQEAIVAVEKRLERAKKKAASGPVVGIGDTTSGGEFFARVADEERQAQLDLNRLKDNELKIKKELERREVRIQELAEYRQKLAEDYADQLGFNNDLVVKFDESWVKATQSIVKAFAEFGIASEDLSVVQERIEDIQNIDLRDIAEGGSEALKGLMRGLGGAAGLEARKALAGALEKALNKQAIEALQEGSFGLADIFQDAAEEYGYLSDSLKRSIEISGIKEARREALALAEDLKTLGLTTDTELKKAELSAFTKELNGLLSKGISPTNATIADLLDKITRLNEEIDTAEADAKLDKILNRDLSFDEFLTLRLDENVETDTLKAFNLELAKSEQLARATFENFMGEGSATGTELERAIQRFLDAQLAAKVQKEAKDLRESIETSEESLKNLSEQLTTGLIDREDEVSGRLTTLTQQVADLRALQALDGGSLFTKDDLDALIQAETALARVIQLSDDMKKAAQLTSFLEQQISFVGQAFLEASQSGENFFTVLKRTFLDAFRALVAKLITLIILFTILSIVAGGSGAAAGVAQQALGGADAFSGAALGNVLASGFGLSKSLSVSSGPASSSGAGLATGGRTAITGSLSGDNIVFSNQRGTRAIDRTFG